MYLDNRFLFSHSNFNFFLIIGANGCGKTYSCKRLIFKQAIYNNKKFMWLRTTKTMIDELKENKGYDFFNDIKHHFKKCEGEINNTTITINNKYVGRLGDISTFFNKKGRSFDDIDYIVYDEFIDEIAQKPLRNKTIKFIKTLEAIVRLKPNVKIILTANAIDKGDEILQLFNFNIKNYGYYINKKLGAILWYVKDNEDYHKAHKESIGGRLMPDYILNNEFKGRNFIYFDSLPIGAKFLYALQGENNKMSIYSFNDELYINNLSDRDNRMCLVNSLNDVSTSTTLINKRLLDVLRKLFNNHKIRFKNQFIEKSFINFIT